MTTPKPIVMKGYAIWNPVTEKWSRGGVYNSNLWAKKPKIWSAVSHIKNHINQLVIERYHYQEKVVKIRNYYKGCEVLDMTTMQPATDFNIYDYARDYAERFLEERKKHSNGWIVVEEN